MPIILRKLGLSWLPLLALCMCLPTRAAAGTVVDQLQRRVIVPDDPGRVISLAPSITEIVFALKQENRLKGVTRYSDYPSAAKKLPRIGSYVRLDIERIVALNPDLCIATRDGNPKTIIDRLASLHIPVYVVNPHNLESILQTILEIGAILNAGHRAKTLTASMRSRVQRVISRVAQINYRPRVFFQIGISPIISAGSDTFIHELIETAGGINLAEGRSAYPRFSREQVLALKPEVFIITSMARQAGFEQVKADWRRWPNMPAVRDERIFLVDSDLFDRPSPRLVSGLELLTRLIHPELQEQSQ
ncbi:Vitamin B12 ABC transporter, substrate-binding protein BtuF [Olavius sp. associated proteobacterium Delta 1]|nr:Vitamin B12 ABC transporter, substrate-binding protein BtuF [Olavius sp. associated proteobacterium Delta 1]